jgi:hypothetical protein
MVSPEFEELRMVSPEFRMVSPEFQARHSLTSRGAYRELLEQPNPSPDPTECQGRRRRNSEGRRQLADCRTLTRDDEMIKGPLDSRKGGRQFRS